MESYFSSYDQIIKGLFLGNSDAAIDPRSLEAMNVSHILVVGKDLDVVYPTKYIYKTVPAEDSARFNICQYFEETNEFIEQGLKAKGVLVHCQFGISRSSTIVIAYLMRSKKQSFVKSFHQVRHKRQLIKPNSGFIKQLMGYEAAILASG